MPSFGLLKEQILTNLEKKYAGDKKQFEQGVSNFVKALKKSKVYTELFHHYKTILESHFDDQEYAKEYLTETVNYLQSLKISDKDRTLFESLERANLKPSEIDPYIRALDTLVFASKKSIKERLEAKQLLVQKLITESKVQIDPKLQGVFLDILQRKLKSRLANLTESELSALTAFGESDEEKILSTYIHLIDDNITAIDEQYTQHGGSSEHFAKLRQVKERLLEMKKEKPSLGTLEKLLVLKEGFGE